MKVGDWVNLVRDDGIIFDTFQYDNDWNGKNGFSLELWQPKEGEWCWMWNDGFDKPYLEKLMKIDKNGKFYAKSVGDRFKHCEPFIGELPSFIKDKQ